MKKSKFSDQQIAFALQPAETGPGKPTDNAFIENFNARVRFVYLNQHWFRDLDDARTKSEL
jgi:transposase InsO family protein